MFLENFQAEKKGAIAPRGVSLVSGFPVPGRVRNFEILAETAIIDFNHLKREISCDYSCHSQATRDKVK
jgi:hypothetical protein